ncbi:RagB/SusD family nutrient uptake outer membrane protein [Sinomicrobium soli]|uniref:RagB/SusD family nutrient uptake outer membrane protein n=1 Tax=Sinomicrobium sp. N-1-3-6 TaxID=2219864 RepID=UPI000DCEE9FD|nr:RagB/SusD family nutrient uptake outer membrane protein [Sinomicrobium sp. N-1-3-6]RAV29644.1 RagB/SusD family nutrient uptake outer membrane protein [Sinomicrobium sp. N-1-3-6]
MTSSFKTIALLGICSLFFLSCESLLETDPMLSIDSETALSSVESIEAATVGCYSQLRNTDLYGREYIVYPELMGNTAAHSGRRTNNQDVANNVRGVHMGGWRWAYEAITSANEILEALEGFEASQEWKDGIAGQLHFLRALYYHNLSRVYGYDPTAIGSSDKGTVPLILTSIKTYGDIKPTERAPIEVMYAQLYADLEKAYELLAGTPASTGPHFATQGAAAALFTRVALYNGDYEKVVEWADKAITSGVARFSTHDSYVADWRAETHPESLFEVEFKVDQNIGITSSIRSAFTTRVNEEGTQENGNGDATVSDELYTLYEEEDVRKQLIMKGLGNASDANEMTKFFSRGGAPNLDNVPVIRLSEVYLNRAEAHAGLGEEAEALADVNRIRERAGLDPVSGLIEENLLDEIWKQRKLELAFEGHSFFEYKRLGQDIVKPNGTVFRFTDYRILAMIPWREFNANKALSQNRGY